MSRTNHHRRNVKRWNILEPDIWLGKLWTPERGSLCVEEVEVGMETWDLRFYAGCRRQPEVVHRVLHFHRRHPWRFHYGPGNAGPAAEKWEAKFRGDTRRYEDECRATYNAGYDVDDVLEPNLRPRSIEYDLW